MASLLAVVLGLLASAALAAADAAPSAGGRATCASPGAGGACLPAGAVTGDEEDGALAMLQHAAKATDEKKAGAGAGKRLAVHGREDPPNATLVWEQLKASVEMQELEGLISNASSSEIVEKLQEKLAKLQAQFPSAEELKAQFSDVWENVTKAVDMDRVKQKLDEANAAGSAEAEKLQKQFDDLKAQVQGFNISSVQAQAASAWAKLQETGASLPDLSNLTVQAQDVLDQAADAAQDALGSATDAVSDAWGSITGILR